MRRTGVAVVCGLAALAAGIYAQVLAGSRLFGTVVDPSGSPVPDAELKITATATGISITVPTGADGTYVAPQLVAGTYEIDVSKPGFKRAKVTGILVQTNESVRRNVQLEVGAVATTVEVQARAELTNTYTAQLSQTVNARQVQDLPLNGRDLTQLTLIVAGASVTDSSTAFYSGSSGFTTTTAVVNGNRTQDNVYMLDGLSNMFMQRRVSNLYPNPDAIEEFTLNTSQYSAEYGGNPGAQLSARTKSGTNTLHGSLFEFVRNGEFNARNAFDVSGKNDGLKRNQYGWSAGGPVYLPKVFNGKNRLFWFNSYQSTPIRQPGVPGFHESWTRKEKDGDFTEHLKGVTKQAPSPACDGSLQTVDVGTIFDPDTANSKCGSPGFPFPGNMIPKARLDPVMQSILNKHTPDSPYVGFLIPHFIPKQQDEWQMATKIDYILGGHQVMGRYLYGKRFGPAFNDPKDLLWQVGTNEGGNTTEAKSLAITDTWAISPHVIMTGGFGWLQNPFAVNPHPFRTSFAAHGSRLENDPGCQDLNFTVAGRGTVRVWDRCNTRDTHSWEVNDAVKWVRDKHEITIGGSVARHHADSTAAKRSGGGGGGGSAFTFGGQFTGIAAADAVLGRAQTYFAPNFGVAVGFQRSQAALYIQDNYRVTRRLTLNLGARWDPGFSARHKDGFMSWIRQGAQSQRFRNAPVGILYHGDPNTPDGSNYTRWDQVAPRIGFAFDPKGNGKWAIRGGLGSYFGMITSGGNSLEAAGTTFPPLPTGGVTVINPPNMVWPWDAPPFNGKAGIPIPPPTADVAIPLPIDGWSVDPYTPMPNTWNWSFTIERTVSSDLLLRAGYVGSRGTHLIGGQEVNLAQYIPGASTIANVQQRRPDPNFGAVNITSGSADSYYHSLQLSAEKRYSRGLTFLANYTLQKSIDTSSNDIGWGGSFGNQDPRGPWFNRGLSEWDRTHLVSTSVVWDVPKFPDLNPVAKYALSNWQLSSMVFLRSGNPITPVSSKGNSLSPSRWATVDRADLVPGIDWHVSGRNRDQQINVGYFNQAAFQDNAIGTRGTVGRSVIRAPGFASTDAMVARIFPIKERLRLQFRAEFFNLFNRVNFKTITGHATPAFTDVSNPNFGKLSVVGAEDPRILQFGLKMLF